MKTYYFLFDRLAYLFEKCVCDRGGGGRVQVKVY